MNKMDITGLKSLSAVSSSAALLLRFCTRTPPGLRRGFRVLSFQYEARSLRPRACIRSASFTSLRCTAVRNGPGNGFDWGADEAAPTGELLQVVLVSPQIPGNTGCIARTCAASSVKLHLVEPLGFQVDDAKLKRAGLDYWPYVVVKVHGSWSEFRDYFKKQDGEKRLLAFTKFGSSIHSEFTYKTGDWLVFGSETSGLPAEALADCKSESLGGGTIRIPMVETYVRCLNLSVSVGIALYEASRQLNYQQFHSAPEPCLNGHVVTEDIFA